MARDTEPPIRGGSTSWKRELLGSWGQVVACNKHTLQGTDVKFTRDHIQKSRRDRAEKLQGTHPQITGEPGAVHEVSRQLEARLQLTDSPNQHKAGLEVARNRNSICLGSHAETDHKTGL